MLHNKHYKWLKCVVLYSVMLSVFLYSKSLVFAEGFETEYPYVVTVYNEQNGLPTGEANVILQSRDGHIWIGSYGGLIRYDGTDFRNFSKERAIDSDSIRTLYEDSQGRLWIGTNDKGVVMMQDDVFTQIESPSDNSFSCIRDFAETKDGSIYVASPSGIAQIVDSKVVPMSEDSIQGKGVFSIAIDSYQRVWGCTETGECLVLKDGNLVELFPSEKVFETARIYCIDSDEQGRIVVGTSVNKAAIIGFSSESLKREDLLIEEFSTDDVSFHNVIESVGGFLMISGNNGLAIVAPNGVVKTFGEERKAMAINCAIIDYEQNVWMASSNYGVIKYSQGCFEALGEKAAMEGIAVNAITKIDKLWYVAHDSGIIICNRNWKHIQNELTEKLKGIRVRQVMADSKGRLWIAGR